MTGRQTVAALVVALLSSSCVGGPPMTADERELLVGDVAATVEFGAGLADDPRVLEYSDALTPLMTNFVSGNVAFDWATAFQTVDGLKPGLEAALSDELEPGEVRAAMLIIDRVMARLKYQADLLREPPSTAGPNPVVATDPGS